MVRAAVDAAAASRLDPVLVVTGHQADKVGAALAGAPVSLVHNARFEEGLSSSLAAGVAAVPEDCDGAMILLGDMPDISPALIDRLIAGFDPLAVARFALHPAASAAVIPCYGPDASSRN